jgi:hypothetical protein
MSARLCPETLPQIQQPLIFRQAFKPAKHHVSR